MERSEQSEIEDHLRRQIEAYHDAGLLFAAVKLGLPEAMGEAAWTADALAAEMGLSAPHLHRFLRGLVTLGLCAEDAEGRFTLTGTGRSLASSASRLREKSMIVIEQYWRPWAELAATVESGQPAFESVFGADVTSWRRDHAGKGAMFEAYLAGETFTQVGPIVEALDLSGVSTVAEIGGGYGALLAAVLLAHPELTGILLTAPHTLSGARVYLQSHGLAGRAGLVGGDATAKVPVEADVYLLKGVLQQHGNEAARAILENCRAAMKPGARLAVIERLLPERPANDPAAVILDLHLMTIYGGRARTRAEMEALLTDGGLAVEEVARTTEGLSVIHCARR